MVLVSEPDNLILKWFLVLAPTLDVPLDRSCCPLTGLGRAKLCRETFYCLPSSTVQKDLLLPVSAEPRFEASLHGYHKLLKAAG